MIKVLVIDDSALVRKLFGRVFASQPDFEVEFARDGLDGLAKLHSFKPHVATLDINMPHMDGLECLDRIMVEHPCPVVMVSSLSTEGADATLEALRLGAVDFVTKPSGAVSLQMDAFAPQLIEKVRSAAAVRIRASARLRERVKHRFGAAAPRGARPKPALITPAIGAGIVVIGTSTGGPPALETVLTALPAHFGWPIVIAQHMPASFTGPLANRLDGLCAIAVREVSRMMPLEAGCAYIGRGDADIVITRRDGVLAAISVSARKSYPWHPSTERLVQSALEHLPPGQIVGVLMTGMGTDGARAMTELHQQGGRTIAESEESAVVWGMPGELVRLNGAGWITPLAKIAGQMQELVPHALHP
ncbi:MAG: chemotaxis-specific protein-glutamate methyltransferase CheB [Rhodospirillaceae bacterium]